MTLVDNRVRLDSDDDLVTAVSHRPTRRPLVFEVGSAYTPRMTELLRAIDGAAVLIAPDSIADQVRRSGFRAPVVADDSAAWRHVEAWNPDASLDVVDRRLVAGQRGRRWTPPMSGWWPIEASRARLERATAAAPARSLTPDEFEQLAQEMSAVPRAQWGSVALDLTPQPLTVALLDERGHRVVARFVGEPGTAPSAREAPGEWGRHGLELALTSPAGSAIACDDAVFDLVVAAPRTNEAVAALLDDESLAEIGRTMRYEARLVIAFPCSADLRTLRAATVECLRRSGFHVASGEPADRSHALRPSPIIEARKVSNVRPPDGVDGRSERSPDTLANLPTPSDRLPLRDPS